MKSGGRNTNSAIEIRSLREQVYNYLRNRMHIGKLLPGAFIDMKGISRELGISKTPLRDAMIQLECEGFVEILPRRGVLVKKLTIRDVKNILEILGALESAVLLSVFDKIRKSHIKKLSLLNQGMISAVGKEDFDLYYKLNIDFHDVFINLTDNTDLQRIVIPLKQRLYDFPRRKYIKKWEMINCDEHEQLIGHMKHNEPKAAEELWRNSHWSFEAYEKFIRQFYADSEEQVNSQLAWRGDRTILK